MKKFSAAFILLFISTAVLAQQGIKFENTAFADILKKAKAENKLVFMDAMASWCGPCKLMDKNVFSTQAVGDYYNANFINAKFDMEKGEGREIAQRFGVNSYPTYLFINGDGQLVSKNYGYMQPNTFVELGKEAVSAVKNIKSMRERFDQGEASPEFLISVIQLNAKTDYEFAKLASERYFKVKKTPEFSRDEIGYLVSFIKSASDPNFKVFEDNKAELIKIVPEHEYVEFSKKMQLNQIVEKSILKDKNLIDEPFFLKSAALFIGKEEAEKQLAQLKFDYYLQTGNFSEFQKIAKTEFEGEPLKDRAKIFMAAQMFLQNSADKDALKDAQLWIHRDMISRGETAEASLLLAKLYLKTGNRDEAKMFAELSKSLLLQQNRSTAEADTILQQIK